MVVYDCFRCGYITSNKTNMRLHLSKKNPCKPKIRDICVTDYGDDILSGRAFDETGVYPVLSHFIPSRPKSILCPKSAFTCEFCTKQYAHKCHLTRHLKTCRIKKGQHTNDSSIYEMVRILNQQLQEERDARKQHQSKLHELTEKMSEIIERTNMPIIESNGTKYAVGNVLQQHNQQTIHIQNIIQTNNIRLSFDDTSYDKVTNDQFVDAVSRTCNCLPTILESIHFNPQIPENHNIYISGIKSKFVMIYDGERWVVCEQNRVFEQIIDRTEIAIEDWLQNGTAKYPELMRKFEAYRHQKDNDENGFVSQLNNQIKLLLYNKRHIAMADNSEIQKLRFIPSNTFDV